jgi:hypothetical protein
MPSHDTFGDVFRVLDPNIFEQCFREWIGGWVGVVKDRIALDGKTIRGSKDGAIPPLHLVSAYATSLGLTLCQEGVVGKGNELKAIRALPGECCWSRRLTGLPIRSGKTGPSLARW